LEVLASIGLSKFDGAVEHSRPLHHSIEGKHINLSHISTPALESDLAPQLRTATPEDAVRLVPFINRVFARDNYFERTERTNSDQIAEYLQKGIFFLKEVGDGLLG
jgi:hypothetical protein